jgi:predicted flap endonuclease-1-like 5' DNA nuclease
MYSAAVHAANLVWTLEQSEPTMANDKKARDDSDQASVPNEDDEPTREGLYDELRQVFRRGVGNPDKPLLDLIGLRQIAQIASLKEHDAEKIEDMLGRATERLGGIDAAAVQALLGLANDTRGHELSFRRETAAKRHNFKTSESFRAHHEKELLMAVATQLLVFADRQRLDDRERRLLAQEARLQELEMEKMMNRSAEHLIANGESLASIRESVNELQQILDSRKPVSKTKLAHIFRKSTRNSN